MTAMAVTPKIKPYWSGRRPDMLTKNNDEPAT